MKKTKSRNSYDAIVKLGEGFFNDENAIPVLIEAVVLMYKRLLNEKKQNMELPLSVDDVFSRQNNDFDILIESHDALRAQDVREKLSSVPEYADLSKNIYGRIGKKSGKRVKKKTTCIIKCIKKAIRNKAFGIYDKELLEAFYAFHFSIREAFINIRMTLKPDWYRDLPDGLTMSLDKGHEVKVKDLFAYDDSGKKYVLDKGKLTRDELLMLQVTIVKYFFKRIYPQFS